MRVLNAILLIGISFAILVLHVCAVNSHRDPYIPLKCPESRSRRARQLSVKIRPCHAPADGKYHNCIVHPNQTYNVTVSFKPIRTLEGGRVVALATLSSHTHSSEWEEFSIRDAPRFCNQLLHGASCPLKAGEKVFFHYNFLLKHREANMQYRDLDIRLMVKDENQSVILCFIMEVCYEKECDI